MSETIKLVLSLSLSGSILAILLFAIKPLIKHRLSKSIQYYIWIVILLRLILPLSFEDSIMNDVFYSNSPSMDISAQSESPRSTSIMPNVKTNVKSGLYNGDTDHNRYFRDLLYQYVLYIWLFGTITAVTVNIAGYIRFLKNLRQGNKPATDEENRILTALLNGRKNVSLVRNRFVTTPMLIGILRPYIIIPDIDFCENQLKHVLRHEIIHLKRFDIVVKWLMMIATSIHWFNPLVYFIKKEINYACELACDEAVIRSLNASEKQAYGDTLISIVAEHKYPAGVLQATMCEEKKSLKERLIAIMNYRETSKYRVIFSAILLGCVVFGALYVGAGVGIGKDVPEKNKTVVESIETDSWLTDISKYKTPYVGNHIKVSGVAGRLPAPDKYFRHQYISLKTQERPYGLTIYYEPASDEKYEGVWPIVTPDSAIEANFRTNALIAFCMIDNLDEITFAFRISQSEGKLDVSKYDTAFTFQRRSFEEKYGDLSVLAENIDLLQDIIDRESKY